MSFGEPFILIGVGRALHEASKEWGVCVQEASGGGDRVSQAAG